VSQGGIQVFEPSSARLPLLNGAKKRARTEDSILRLAISLCRRFDGSVSSEYNSALATMKGWIEVAGNKVEQKADDVLRNEFGVLIAHSLSQSAS